VREANEAELQKDLLEQEQALKSLRADVMREKGRWEQALESLKMVLVCPQHLQQSLTSVRIKDCTLRVPNKTTTLFLSEQ